MIDRSDCPVMRLLVNRTRLRDVEGPALAQAHREVGAALAPFAARRCDLEDVEIEHVAGVASGVRVSGVAAPVVLALMRAGLFVAEGVWGCLPGAALVPWDGREVTLEEVPVEGRPVILVDSVINSGASIIRALEMITRRAPCWVTVAALVANDVGLRGCQERWPAVDFAVARVSQRSYVGRGATDTGARLFGTTQWAREQRKHGGPSGGS